MRSRDSITNNFGLVMGATYWCTLLAVVMICCSFFYRSVRRSFSFNLPQYVKGARRELRTRETTRHSSKILRKHSRKILRICRFGHLTIYRNCDGSFASFSGRHICRTSVLRDIELRHARKNRQLEIKRQKEDTDVEEEEGDEGVSKRRLNPPELGWQQANP